MSEDRAAAALDAALARARAQARRDANARPDVDESTRRLDALLVALEPALARLPEADLFDVGLMRGAGPGAAATKLCLDMAGRVEWRDAQETYVLSRLTPRGRVTLGQADDLDGAVDLVCDYLASRIVARERAAPARDDAQGAALDRDGSRETRRIFETRETALAAFAREAGSPVESQGTRDRREESHVERQEARERRLSRRDGRGPVFEATREAELRAEREAMIARRERDRLERARGRCDDAAWEDYDDDAPRSPTSRPPTSRPPARARVAENAAGEYGGGEDAGRVMSREAESQERADEAATERRSRRSWRARLGALWPRGRLRRLSDHIARRRIGAGERALVFVVQFLGSAALTLIVALTAWWAWRSAGVTLLK